MSYTELHCHSTFSLLDGASSPEALVERALRLGHRALALTDHDDLGGAVRFAQAASTAGIDAIVGVELSVSVEGAAPDEPPDRMDSSAPRPSSLVPRPSSLASRPSSLVPRPSHLVLLAESREGYGNLASLVTRARMDSPRGRPAVSLDTLAAHARGLFALTGCPRGWVPQLLARDDDDGACEALATLADIFERRVAVECWDHHLPEERALVRRLIPLARALDLPWVVTNDVHYAAPRGRIVHDVLSCLRHERTLDQMGTRLRPSGEWYLKSAAQMRRRWQHDDAGLRATLEIAERCGFRLEQLTPSLPAFPLPAGVTADEYLARLVEQGAGERWGAASRLTSPAPASGADGVEGVRATQLAMELALIRQLGLAGYFLIVWDIVRFARREGILCQGRGSAANSAVCYCLGITAVDPIRMELLFARFLSEERQEAPDIDLDFAHRDRERVLQYVYQRYGREHAAMVCEQITYRGRSAVRDAARVLGFSVEQAATLSTLSDRFSARATAESLRGGAQADGRTGAQAHGPEADADKALADSLGSGMVRGTEATTRANAVKRDARKVRPGADAPRPSSLVPRPSSEPPRPSPYDPHAPDTHKERRDPTTAVRETRIGGAALLARAGFDANDRRVRALAEVVDGLHQAPRHRSIHVGGFVLTAEPLRTVVPIEPASMADRTVIQWEKDDLEFVGLVKIDLLGLGILTVLQDCLKYIRQTRGVTIDLGQLDMTDQAVYDDLCRADTIGVFQVESRAQMNTLPRLKPRSFYDLVVEVALIRPGPIQGDMVHPYLRRRAGTEAVTYPHPKLEPILRRTLGIPLFQEQGMQVAIACAGFSPGEADNLRRAMGHKRSHERMAAICEQLISGMEANGIPEETARRIYHQINAFADYGFPESHAASFALLVYASAYLRHYYAPEFTAAILNAQPMGFYAPGTLVEDAKRHGVVVLPVDLTRSAWDATLEQPAASEPAASEPAASEPAASEPAASERTAAERTSDRPAVQSRGGTRHAMRAAPSRPAPAVRLGLQSVRGLGSRAREKLERALASGPFVSVADVVRRSALDRRSLRFLAEAGAFDTMVPHGPASTPRRDALWALLEEIRGVAGPLAPAVPSPRPPPLPVMSRFEITEADYRMTSMSLNGHPMRHLRELLAPNGVLAAQDILAQGRDGERVAAAGLVICRQRPGTAKGFVFLTLEDETGMVNVVITPKRFERQALMISTSPLILVRGTLQVESGVVNLRGERFRALDARVGAEFARRHDFH